MRGRDRDAQVAAIRDVAAELDGLLDELRGTVAQLNAILAAPPDGASTAGVGVPAQ